MSSVSSLGSQPSAIGADALRPAGSGDVAGRSWFQDWGGEGSAGVLHADVEANAKGLSADQHAERVLSHLVEGR
jgi:hypothetical protein